MNEQLVVKNFGPIKDATVGFKRVTVFIGPTGGGKSTLAKLAAVFREDEFLSDQDLESQSAIFNKALNDFLILDYLKTNGSIKWESSLDVAEYDAHGFRHDRSKRRDLFKTAYDTFNRLAEHMLNPDPHLVFANASEEERVVLGAMHPKEMEVYYVPADRAFASALESGLAGLVLKGVALPGALLSFLNEFKIAQNNLQILPLKINFLKLSYRLLDKQAKVDLGEDGTIDLAKSASGIQAVIPMMLVINNATGRRSQQVSPYSFIIEEPELNLYPTAQQGLLNWLVEKCANPKSENDLTITTHSPYILSHLNLLLYAYQVAEQHPDRAEDVAKIVPRENWINPKEFAAYHVEGQKENGVHTIVNPETGLISYNGLDALAGSSADEFDKLLDISAGLEVE